MMVKISNSFVAFDEKVTNQLYKLLLAKKYKLEFRLWETEEDRYSRNVKKYIINDQSLTMAILNPHYFYKEGGSFEIWAIGPDSKVIYHHSETIQGLYIYTLKDFNLYTTDKKAPFIIKKT